jgi:hypothetical protein
MSLPPPTADRHRRRPAGRVAAPKEVAALAAFVRGTQDAFITGSDFLSDGGVIAAIATGRFSIQVGQCNSARTPSASSDAATSLGLSESSVIRGVAALP